MTAREMLAPWLGRREYAILVGQVLAKLGELPARVFRTCVTSPPYWGLRDYGVDGQIGLEATPEEWVRVLVEVFRGVRRVLADDGTIWVNCGDAYAGSRKAAGDTSTNNRGQEASRGLTVSRRRDDAMIPRSDVAIEGLKPKDLIGLPWMLAFALRADGWYLRSDVIWHKPNPMPESVTDRPTKAHDYLFLLSKSKRYFYDADAIFEHCSENTHLRVAQSRIPDGWATDSGPHDAVSHSKRSRGVMPPIGGKKHAESGYSRTVSGNAVEPRRVKNNESFTEACCPPVYERNKRTVWEIPTQGYKEAHFATFPEALVEPCVLAGSAVGDAVLDPFSGSGTTGVVATRHGRLYIGTELNPEYAKMSERRIRMALRPATAVDERAHEAPLFGVGGKL